VRSIAARARELAAFARREGVDVAVSHNSYAQAVAARAARIPCVTAMDYEYQPANHIAFRCARRVLVPEAFPDRMLRLEGARPRKVWRYYGFKEEAYLHGFAPDPSVLAQVGLREGERFLVARPSPQGAAYHQFANQGFDRALREVLERGDARVVLLPRREADLEPYAGIPEERKIVPAEAVDTRSLLFYATALLGAGGTMNREAALLGTPVFGFFEGRLAALDRRLIDEGRLRPADGDAGALHAELERLLEDGGEREVHPVTSHVRDRFVEAILTPF
jgi:predicted glycosyltransferase